MTDRYLFRGKRIDGGEWIIGDHVKDWQWGDKFIPHVIRKRPPHDWRDKSYAAEIDPATIGQCSGLRDKNGRLAFEGDIIVGSESRFKIAWSDNGSQWECWLIDSHSCVSVFPLNCFDVFEIVGNIHDTPSLLSEGAE